MRVIHAWLDYTPDLFDRAHPLCLDNGVASHVVCQTFIDSIEPLAQTRWLRRQAPQALTSTAFTSRAARALRRPIDGWRFASLLASEVGQQRADVVHVHFGTTGAVLAQWGELPDKPLMVSFYGADASQSLRDPRVIKRYGKMFAKAALVHVLCDEVADRLVRRGCPREKIVIANLPAKVEGIPDIGTSPDGPTRYLIPARFVEKKGHRVLLAAFKPLLQERPGIRLTCFGYGDPAWLHKAVADMDLSASVEVVDNRLSGSFLDPYLDMLRRHDVVLAPSVRATSGDDEGGPALTLVMAQAAGKPVIASNFPGIERSVSDGVEGLIVPEGDPDALHGAMASIDGDADAWRRFGRAGRARVMEEFSDASYWAFLRASYDQMINAPGRRDRA
jgi:glycosyltransferase involved in cell wall biosynthesis